MNYKLLNLKYSLVYIGYMFLSAVINGYAFNYLSSLSIFKDNGHINTLVIGYVLGLMNILIVASQTIFASIIDKSNNLTEKKYIMISSFIAVLFGVMMFFVDDKSPLLIIVMLISFVMGLSGIPILNNMAFIYEKEGKEINFGLCRGVGSLAYAIGAFFLGLLWARFGKDIIPTFMVIFGLFTFIAICLMPEAVIDNKSEEYSKELSYTQFFKKYKSAIFVFLAMTAALLCHGMINTYSKVFIETILGEEYILNAVSKLNNDVTISSPLFVELKDAVIAKVQGRAVSLAAGLELPAMYGFSKLMKKVNVEKILIFSIMMFFIKALTLYFCNNEIALYLSMSLQFFSYALMIPASVYWINDLVSEGDRNKGQAVMYASSTIGLLIASIAGGSLFEILQVRQVLMIGIVITLIGVLIMVYGLQLSKKELGE